MFTNLGGGIIGCSTAYFLTRHPHYDPKKHSITILEASRIGGGSSGKAGGLLADWATPKCLAPLSFATHAALAKEHGGDKLWTHRYVYCAEVELQGQDLDSKSQNTPSPVPGVPKELDWLLPGSIKKYQEAGTPNNSAQVHPYLLTTSLARLAEEKGANIILGSATSINYKKGKTGIESVSYSKEGKSTVLEATDILIAAGPWTPRIFPAARITAPRGHSVVVRPTRELSPYVLFPQIEPPPNSKLHNDISPEIYPRSDNTVYASGPDDYEVPLPPTSDDVVMDSDALEDVWNSMRSVSREINDGEIFTKQACYKPHIRDHEEDEEVGPIVGPTGVNGLWVATGHDEWGI